MRNIDNNFFIEAGINHFGKIHYAKKIFNFFSKSSFRNISFMIHKKKFYEKFKKKGINFKLSNDLYFKMIKDCKRKKKKFGFSVCDTETFQEVFDLNVDFYKLLSVGIDNIKLIQMLKSKNKPIYISTGFNASEKKIKKCLKLFNKYKNIQLLHAPMTYNFGDLNFKQIIEYKKKYKIPVGYSNHFNRKEIFNILSSYNPETIFIYCKPQKKKGRIYPDDQHAFFLDELELIKSKYKLFSKVNNFAKSNKLKINIFNHEIKY